MRMLCTLIKPTSGSIVCNGRAIFEMDGEYRKLLGYLPQEFGFYPEFTVHDYLIYIASINGSGYDLFADNAASFFLNSSISCFALFNS